MTGTGEVTKRRLKEGDGEFPIDCPLNDTTIRVHYRVRQLALRQQQQQSQSSSAGAQGDGGGWVYDTRDAKAAGGGAAGESPDHPQGAGVPPLEIDTGCGEAPEAVEMCAKLMVPGELALVRVTNPR
jgi:FK506-binding protein 4/5